MRFLLLLVASALAAGCLRPPRASTPDASAPAPVEDCTLATRLVPGVPGSPGHLLPSERNPNGASELAALMRTMQNDVTAARGTILDGGVPPPMFARHRAMRCSWPTDLADRNEKFDGLAQAYLAAVQQFDQEKRPSGKAFDSVLSACHTCHDNSCPGPLVVIDALRITPLDAGAATQLVQQ